MESTEHRETVVCATGVRTLASWGSLASAAFAGLATTIVLATLGAAIGITTGAGMESAGTAEDARETATGFGLGAGVWGLLSAAIVGIVAGRVLLSAAMPELGWRAAASAVVTWALGLSMGALLAAVGAGGILAGLGGASAGIGAVYARGTDAVLDRDLDRDTTRGTARNEVVLTAEEADAAAKAAASAAWFALVAQMVGLVATVLTVRKGTERAEGQSVSSSPRQYVPA
jgi:hypothetical protein